MLLKLKRYRGLEWFALSRIHYETSKILYENKGHLGIVCFHIQQGMEKMLKGYILIETGKLLDGHNIVKLVEVASSIDSEFGRFIVDCPFINTFYIETKYPGEDPLWVKIKDVDYGIRIYNEMYSLIQEKIGLKD